LVEAERGQQRGKARKEPLLAALQVWEGDLFSHRKGEKEDGYFDLCFRNTDPLDREFEKTARAVFRPLLDHMEEEKP
jgi:exodeoxyribonuclease V gamma subunit